MPPKIVLDKKTVEDKIHACWIGKNIGGTLGGPYEGKREFLNVTGFTTKAGKPLPNDDLDLQIMWLIALEKEGPYHFNNATLAEYWTLGITPDWNEYGTAKANLYDGIMPPLSGELNNDYWKHSNGAWIRSEIWACLTPYYPDFARKNGVSYLLKGVRNEADFLYEQKMADINRSRGVETLLLPAAPELCSVSSSELRRRLDEGEAYGELLPPGLEGKIKTLLDKP